MHGFPLKITAPQTRYYMCTRKRAFATEQAAWDWDTNPSVKAVYNCPICGMFHRTCHEPTNEYEQRRWWILWMLEVDV